LKKFVLRIKIFYNFAPQTGGYSYYVGLDNTTAPTWDDGYGNVSTHPNPGGDINTYFIGGYSPYYGDIYVYYNGSYYVWLQRVYVASNPDGNLSSKEDYEHYIQTLEPNITRYKKLYDDSEAALKDSIVSLAKLGKAERDSAAVLLAAETARTTANTARSNALTAYNTARTAFDALPTPQARADSLKVVEARVKYDGRNPFTGILVDVKEGAVGAYNDASTYYWAKNDAHNAALNAYNTTNDRIKTLNNQVISNYNTWSYYTSQKETYLERLALLQNGTRPELQIAVYETAEAYDAAYDAYYFATNESGRLTNEIRNLDVLGGIYTSGDYTYYTEYSTSYVNSQITYYTDEIVRLEALLASYQVNLAYFAEYASSESYDYDGYSASTVAKVIELRKAEIADLKAEIAGIEAIIPALQKNVDYLKAAIDALLAQ
jgi:hypothetical protein